MMARLSSCGRSARSWSAWHKLQLGSVMHRMRSFFLGLLTLLLTGHVCLGVSLNPLEMGSTSPGSWHSVYHLCGQAL